MTIFHRIKIIFTITILALSPTCAGVSENISDVILNKAYASLTIQDYSKVRSILKKIESKPSDQKTYYYNQLLTLLNKPTFVPNSNENKKFSDGRVREINDAVENVIEEESSFSPEDLKIISQAEEEYETESQRNWKFIRPYPDRPGFVVDAVDITDIFVRIYVKVNGDPVIVNNILKMEDAIEKHISIPGFSVNLVFTDVDDDVMVFSVNSDTTKWITSINWGGDPETLAHELCHLMGLDDEYDGIANHAHNRFLPMSDRLWYFEHQLSKPFLPDANDGIMSNSYNRPLHRHVCSIAQLDIESCVKNRTEYFKE